MTAEMPQNTEQDASLWPALRAFDAGDYSAARELASGLSVGAQGKARDAVARFLQRVSPDPVMVWVFVTCLLFSIAVVVGYSP